MNALEIANIRQVFPNEELYYISIAGDEFVFRVITPAEYATIKDISTNPYDEEDIITQTAMIYPASYNVLAGGAGVPKILSKLILQFSMIGDEYKEERALRGQAYLQDIQENVESQIPLLIKMAFPEYTFEQIENWSLDMILKRFAQALWTLDRKGVDVSGYDITYTPAEPKTFEERENELLENGIDPVLALYDEYRPVVNVVDFPFISGAHWNNEEICHAVQQQIYQSRQIQK